ncbi:MAG: DNA gyrase inhibitor YacG [Pikeienuella sp.]
MAKCAICKKPVEAAYRPFCSKRCADVDLGKWLTGSYALPSEDEVTEEDLLRAEAESRKDADN